MTKVKEEKKEFLKNKEEVNLKDFMLLKSDEQDKLIIEKLEKVYDNNIEISKKYLDKVLNVAFDNKDNETYLPHSLCIEKNGNKLVFSFRKRNTGLLVLFFLGFLFLAGFATYSGVQLIGKAKMNIDLNGDGVADLNIDLDDDGICDINCDTNTDKKPDKNIDYMGNRKPIFNVLKDDGTIFNKVNQKDENGKCYLNCDNDFDGWPDTNIDLDGDGKPDLNIDVDGDGKPDLNIDTNGDGVADINIDTDNDNKCDKNCISNLVNNKGEINLDTNGDGVCDVNCDTNDDKKPDTNIDYGGNKTLTFNKVDENGNITNKVDQDKNGDGICDLNCDLDGDGWPDINIDLDGDGKADINIDTNGDGTPDINIDTDFDGTPDFNIDEDGDGKCDLKCTYVVDEKGNNGGQQTDGDNSYDVGSASLLVTFENGNDVKISNLYPDDQNNQNVNTKVPDIEFTIENKTDRQLLYNISWVNVENTFTSDNFWVKFVSTNDGYNKDWKSAPKLSGLEESNVKIAPYSKQSYKVSFTLHGTGTVQNYDQGKTFKGKLLIELKEGQ